MRTVVYPLPGAADAAVKGQSAQQQSDNYGDKLVKYIPAEVIAFFLPAYTLAAKLQNLWWVGWLILVLSTLALIGYLLLRSDQNNPPHWYFYILSVGAFLAWAVGTSSAGVDLFHLDQSEITGKLIVMGAVFLIPLVDELLTRYLP